KRPAVRVPRVLPETGDSTAPSASAQPSTPDRAGTAQRPFPTPIPLRRTGQRVFTVTELEASLDAAPRAPEGVCAFQFDAEDGSDRNSWKTRRQRSEPQPAVGPQEQLLRTVLQAWDFRDPQGWRPLLRRAALSLGLVDESEVLERGLEWFVGTNTFAPLPSAAV